MLEYLMFLEIYETCGTIGGLFLFKNKIFLHIVRKRCASTEESENRKKRRVPASCEAKREPKKAVPLYQKTRPKKDNV